MYLDQCRFTAVVVRSQLNSWHFDKFVDPKRVIKVKRTDLVLCFIRLISLVYSSASALQKLFMLLDVSSLDDSVVPKHKYHSTSCTTKIETGYHNTTTALVIRLQVNQIPADIHRRR